MVVPWSDAGVDITRSNAGDEDEVVPITESLDGLPVLVRRAEREAVGSEVGVHAVKAPCQDVMLVTLLHNQSNKDGVVSGATHAVGTGGSQKFRPGLGWSKVRVINVEQRKSLSRAGSKSVEGPMVSIPFKDKTAGYIRNMFIWC